MKDKDIENEHEGLKEEINEENMGSVDLLQNYYRLRVHRRKKNKE